MRDRLNAAARQIPTAALYGLGAIPALGWLAAAGFNRLGPDPVKVLEQALGLWALRFLLASLYVTPLASVGLRLVKFRRALGLLGFAYAILHLGTWLVLDMDLRWGQIVNDLWKRPYIVMGLCAFVLLLPLAFTSHNAVIARMGARAWKRLHRLAYPAILAAAVHFTMIGKVWTAESLIYLGLTFAALLARIPRRRNAPSPSR